MAEVAVTTAMVMFRVGRFFVFAQKTAQLADHELDLFLRQLIPYSSEPNAHLIAIADGWLTASQRAQVVAASRLGATLFPTFLITDSTLTRGVVTAMSWAGLGDVECASRAAAPAALLRRFGAEGTELLDALRPHLPR